MAAKRTKWQHKFQSGLRILQNKNLEIQNREKLSCAISIRTKRKVRSDISTILTQSDGFRDNHLWKILEM
jgi:hypothetical protein